MISNARGLLGPGGLRTQFPGCRSPRLGCCKGGMSDRWQRGHAAMAVVLWSEMRALVRLDFVRLIVCKPSGAARAAGEAGASLVW